MATDSDAARAADPDGRPRPLRGDVVSARSRMRTKYGSQRQIAVVDELLAADEQLLLLVTSSGPADSDRNAHGLLALTDRRLLFVPRTERHAQCDIALDFVDTLYWVASGRVGSLGVRTAASTHTFKAIASADGRDLMSTIVERRPSVRRLSGA